MKVAAPGKLILSGEHAMVYGSSALAMAINRYVHVQISRHEQAHLDIDLPNLKQRHSLKNEDLTMLRTTIQRKYDHFLKGNHAISAVLQQPFELAHYSLSLLLEKFYQLGGLQINVSGNLPIGGGLGSSAALIIGMLYAISEHLHLNLTAETLLQYALEAEKMQHGYSQGQDLKVVLQGGLLFFSESQYRYRYQFTWPLYFVYTGKPQTTTGECVSHVAKFFKASALLIAFNEVTLSMERAIQQCAFKDFQASIKENHKLLTHIEVVPEHVQNFIKNVEVFGSAKICGAGAIAGVTAGSLLVTTEDETALSALCQQYNYDYSFIQIEPRGVHVI
jgi:mevalonate kinase